MKICQWENGTYIKDFLVSYIHVPTDDPKSEIVQELLECMGTDAVEGIMLQCG